MERRWEVRLLYGTTHSFHMRLWTGQILLPQHVPHSTLEAFHLDSGISLSMGRAAKPPALLY